MQHVPPVQVQAPQDVDEAKRRLEEELREDGEVKPNAAPDDGSGGHGGTLPPPPPPPPKD